MKPVSDTQPGATPPGRTSNDATPRGRVSGSRVLLGFGLFVALVFGIAVIIYFSNLDTRLEFEAEKVERVRDFRALAEWVDAADDSRVIEPGAASLPADAALRLRFECDDPVLLYVWRESAAGTRPMFPEDPRQEPHPIRPDDPLLLPYEDDGEPGKWTLEGRRPITLHVRATDRRDPSLENALAAGRQPDLEIPASAAFGELTGSQSGVLHWTLTITEAARDASSPR